jgi:hypothetical protein
MKKLILSVAILFTLCATDGQSIDKIITPKEVKRIEEKFVFR